LGRSQWLEAHNGNNTEQNACQTALTHCQLQQKDQDKNVNAKPSTEKTATSTPNTHSSRRATPSRLSGTGLLSPRPARVDEERSHTEPSTQDSKTWNGKRIEMNKNCWDTKND
jgi:hypothetical protein